MPLPVLVILNILFGVSVAYSARIQIRTLERSVFYNRYFSAVILTQLTIVIPVGLYFLINYPDWSLMYLLDTQGKIFSLSIMTVLFCLIAAIMGYLVGYFSAQGGADWICTIFIFVFLAGLSTLFIAAKSKLFWIGTHAQFIQQTGLVYFKASSVFPSTIVSLAGFATSWIIIVHRFFQEGRLSMRAS